MMTQIRLSKASKALVRPKEGPIRPASNWAFLVLGLIWPHLALFGPNRVQLGLIWAFLGPYYALLSVTEPYCTGQFV